jgi:hypothetical protein
MRDPDTCRAASAGFSPKDEILKATPNRTLLEAYDEALTTFGV